MTSLSDTIAAIATPNQTGGIGIIRISGERAFSVLQSLLSISIETLHPRELTLTTVRTKQITDQCLVVLFPAPHSYTGEDIAEIHCHGGKVLMQEILFAVCAQGARLALAGEFTKRAVLNGKMSLSGAEGVIDMIEAQAAAQINAGYALVKGQLNKIAEQMQAKLSDLLAQTEVTLDQEDEELNVAALKKETRNIQKQLVQYVKSWEFGHMVRDGVSVAVAGKPNVGKSSLMNALLQFDRAIVSEVAGTTRDTVESVLTIDGMQIRLTDTAGIRSTTETIERLGVERSKHAIDCADLVLFVVDASSEINDEDWEIYRYIQNKETIIVANKCDKKTFDLQRLQWKAVAQIAVSAVKQVGIEQLKQKISQTIQAKNMSSNAFHLTNVRHVDALNRAAEHLRIVLNLSEMEADVMAMELKAAWDALGEVTGSTATEDLIEHIFAKFCVGK